jgi:hypothetical protein
VEAASPPRPWTPFFSTEFNRGDRVRVVDHAKHQDRFGTVVHCVEINQAMIQHERAVKL